MRTFLAKVLAGILMACLCCGYGVGVNAAPITKILEEDTKLVPPGLMAIDSIPVFKKGTTVTLNDNGEVIEGTLASDPWLNCVALLYEENGRRYFRQYGYVFREGTKVLFNNKGEVVKGTFSHNHNIKIAVPINGRSYIMLRPLTEATFHLNGVLASGTIDLYAKTHLRPVGWRQINNSDNPGGFVQFKDGTLIELNDKGEVIKGTLNKDSKLLSPGGTKVYEEGTTVEFDDKGTVIKASK